ncbi:MAG TPA: hypothetical protein VMI31_17575, partial [Fimbriimonadaceae bacterium]|nr:hypothetical protein [Fimbriimonadaceae bacterium]
IGFLGIIKALAAALMGLGQAALWAEWKSSSWKRKALAYGIEKVGGQTKSDVKEYVDLLRSDDPPKADDYVAKCFDDMGKIVIGWVASDEWGPGEKEKLLADFNFGAKWGAIPANLMMLGAGGGGLTSKGAQYLFKGLMFLSSLKAIDDASQALGKRIEEIRGKNPDATWWQILGDDEILKQFTTIIVSAISLGTSMAEATDKAKGLLEMLKTAGYVGDWAQLGPILKKAWDDYHDPASDDKTKKDRLEQDAIDFINQVINVGNSTKNKIEEHRQAKAAQATQAAQPEAAPVPAADASKPETAPTPVVEPSGQKAAAQEPAKAPSAEPSLDRFFPGGVGAPPSEGRTPSLPSEPKPAASPEPISPATTEKPPIEPVKVEEPAKAAEPIKSEVPVKAAEPAVAPEAEKTKLEEVPPDAAHDPRVKQADLESEATRKKADLAYATAERQRLKARVDEIGNRPESDPELQARKAALEEAVTKEGEADRSLLDTEKEQIENRKELGIAAPEKAEAILNGTRGEQLAAARELIVGSKSWKETLKEWVDRLPDKPAQEAAKAVLDGARQDILRQARANVLEKNPHLKDIDFIAPGTPGFNSDIDVSVNPRENPDQAHLSVVVERSAELVKKVNEELRRLTGGEPDITLDTNLYSWTGSDVIRGQVRADERARSAQDVASLAEVRRNVADPAAWSAMKEQMIAKAQAKGGDKAAAEMAQQIAAGEKVAEGLTGSIEAAKQSFLEKNARPDGISDQEWAKTAEMRGREAVAEQLRGELVQRLKAPKNRRDYQRIVELQTQIAMAEPGAYANRSAVDEVVNFGQTLVGMSGEAAREKYMTAKRPMDPREVSNSAASSLAQLEDHAKHPATTGVEAKELLKNAVKYSERILNEARKGVAKNAADAGVPELDKFFRKGTTDKEGNPTGLDALIEEYAKEKGTPLPRPEDAGYTKETAEAARTAAINQYAAERVAWAEKMVAELKARAILEKIAPEPSADE